RQVRRRGPDSARQRIAAERAEPDHFLARRLAGIEPHALVIDHDQGALPLDDRSRPREVERHDLDPFGVDVGPDVELGPAAEREDAHALTGREAGVEHAPDLRPLVLGIPGVLGVAVREDALLGAGLLLVAARAPDGGVVAAGAERLA